MELVVKEIAQRQSKSGHDVSVLTTDIGAKKDGKQVETTIPVHRFTAYEFAHTPLVPGLSRKAAPILNNSLVHLHIAQAVFPEQIARSCKKAGVAYVAHVHIDPEPSGLLGVLLPVYKKLFLQTALKKARAVIVPTKAYKILICNRYKINPQKCFVVPNGVEIPQGKKHTTKHSGKQTKLLFVGRLSAQKNIPLLLRACAMLPFEWNLDIVGEGEEKENLIELASQLGISKNLLWSGQLSGAALHNKYAGADIFVTTPKDESFGRTYVEAMISGLPIVTTDIPAARELVGKAGLFCKHTAPAVAHAIKALAADKKKRTEMRMFAKNQSKQFSWENAMNKLDTAYMKAIAKYPQ
jgi:glycosyltransferase involved in cell wall biosynthesis